MTTWADLVFRAGLASFASAEILRGFDSRRLHHWLNDAVFRRSGGNSLPASDVGQGLLDVGFADGIGAVVPLLLFMDP